MICGRAHESAAFPDTRAVDPTPPHRRRRSRREPVPYEFKPHERPFMPGSPATPEHPMPRRVGYFAIGLLLGVAAGFANGLLSANTQQLQGAFGISQVEAAWLTAAYSMTNVCTNLLLIRIRQQFGVTFFWRLILPPFALVSLAQFISHSYEMELLLRGVSGVVGGGMTTFCLFYVVQAVPAAKRLPGMVLAISLSQVALPVARAISPLLLQAGDPHRLFGFELGLSLLALAATTALPLPPSETLDAFEPLDLLTFFLIAPGMALLCAVLTQARIVWWTTAWIGYSIAAAIVLIAAALLVEHNRANPLLNLRWMARSEIVQFALLAATMRILLSEQNFGAAGLFSTLGLTPDRLVVFYGVISLFTVAGLVTSVLTLNTQDLLRPIWISCALIATGAWMDAGSSNLTRPFNLLLSQGMIAFAAIYFIGPLMMIVMFRALSRGPSHMVSYSAVFGISQTLGGLVGTALLGSLQVVRERVHSAELVQTISLTNPLDAARVMQLAGAYGRVLTDPVLRQAEGVAQLAQQVSREANVLAYNDVFVFIAVLATTAFVLTFGRWIVVYRIQGINPLAEDIAEMQRLRQARMDG